MSKKRFCCQLDPWQEARQKWVGKWVWYNSPTMGVELALVRGIDREGDILLSSDFYEQLTEGGFPFPVCTVEEAESVLRVLSAEELKKHGKSHGDNL